MNDGASDEVLAEQAEYYRARAGEYDLRQGRYDRGKEATRAWFEEVEEVMTRRLDGGREFAVVKIIRAAADLVAQCRDAGFDVEVEETPTYFQYGFGRRVAMTG
jgi:hypothetical protein